MAHDANFVGNRLRLSAFLLCVEHGEMPARPSRFRRRPQILDGSATSHATTPPRVDCNVPVLQAFNESSILASKASTEAGAIKANVDQEAAITDKPLKTNVDKDEALSKSPMHVPSIYDIPHSPTPDPRLTPVRINDQDSHNGPEEGQRRSEPKITSQSKRKAIFATTIIVEKVSGNIKGLLNTRKRRLPVHELALLRTTTLDGLPLPGDATVGFATPITVVDPIEDTQIRLAGTLSDQTSRNVIITKRRLSPRTTQPLGAVCSPKTRPVRSPTKPLQRPTPLSADKPRYPPDFRDAFDGFVGPELQLTYKTRPSRRRKRNPIRRQKPSIMRELALEAGSLPVSAARDVATSTVLEVDKTSNPDGRPTLSRHEGTQPSLRAGQLVLTRTQSALQADVGVEGIQN